MVKSKKKSHKSQSSSNKRSHREKTIRKSRVANIWTSSDESDVPYSRNILQAAINRPILKTTPIEILPVSSEEDVDELNLRLAALKSKPEIRNEIEVVSDETIVFLNKENEEKVDDEEEISSEKAHEEFTIEEQELRLIALRSAMLKKTEIRRKKKENELRPYSPTDILEKIEIPQFIDEINENSNDVIDENLQDRNNEYDPGCCTDYSENNMDISPIGTPEPQLIEISPPIDMELESNSHSPRPVSTSLPLNTTPTPENDSLHDVTAAEEDCLRSFLLSNLEKRKNVVIPPILPTKTVQSTTMITETMKKSQVIIPPKKKPTIVRKLVKSEPKIVPKLIIQLGCSTTESDTDNDDEHLIGNLKGNEKENISQRKNSGFQEKLDEFLKNMWSKSEIPRKTITPPMTTTTTTITTGTTMTNITRTIVVKPKTTITSSLSLSRPSTPVAVNVKPTETLNASSKITVTPLVR